MNRKLSSLAIIFAATVLACGCGGGYSSPPPTIQVAFSATAMPPSALAVSGTAPVAATVTNDSANAGVSWSCAPAGSCGSFMPTSTMSGATTTYTAPAASPAGGKVTIVATSVTAASQSASAQVTINGPPSVATLNGQYAFLIRANVGNQNGRGNTTFIGSVNLDGNGNLIALSTQCLNPQQPPTPPQVVCAGMEEIIASQYGSDRADPILPTNPANAPNTSSYSVGANGLGTMRLLTQLGETLDLDFVVTSTSHAEIMEVDGNPGSGSMDLQTTKTGQAGGFDVSQISGTYSFILDGVDPALSPTHKLSIGGVFMAGAAGTISSGTLSVNDNGTIQPGGAALSGSISTVPDQLQNGRGQMILNPTGAPTRTFTFYIVNNKVLRMFEDDGIDFTGGSAYAQGSAAPVQAGKFVYQHSGWNTSAGRTIDAGQFTVAAGGGITGGVSDANAGGAPTVPSTATTATGSYAPALPSGSLTLTDAAGSSTFNVYPVDPTLNILDPNNTSGGGGALLLHTDANIIGSGLILPQSVGASPNITGKQVLNLENAIASSSPKEVVLVGVAASDGSSMLNSGVADYDQGDSNNPLGTIMTNAPFTGTYAPDANFAGHFTGTFNIPPPSGVSGAYPFIIPSTNIFSVSFYQASSSQAFVVQTDTTANSIGRIIQLQLP